jgi:hypothetical protein
MERIAAEGKTAVILEDDAVIAEATADKDAWYLGLLTALRELPEVRRLVMNRDVIICTGSSACAPVVRQGSTSSLCHCRSLACYGKLYYKHHKKRGGHGGKPDYGITTNTRLNNVMMMTVQ